MKKIKILLLLITAIAFSITGCIDDDPVEYNSYDISYINPPVDKVPSGGETVKKVYIGHDLPVNVTITAEYNETDVPLQVYLLNVNDVEEYESGVGYASDMRMYYCNRTPNTTVDQLLTGTNTYGIIINVPAEDSKDELTNDYKTGYYYVLAEVNKDEQAETDAYTVYKKFKSNLDAENIIFVASDHIKKPDLSVESMSFTGGSDNPDDVLVWYNVDLTGLPGISESGLDEDEMIIIVKPSDRDRTFTGTVEVKSSSADALNVPIKFYIAQEGVAFADLATQAVELDIYDKTMNGWVQEYYIPLLKANTTEKITLGLRIPGDPDGDDSSFTEYDTHLNPSLSTHPLGYLRHLMGKTDYGDHGFVMWAVVNPGGSVTESRFIEPDEINPNREYTEGDYYQDGDANPLDNNHESEGLTFTLEKVEVDPNDGIKTYPYCKMTPADVDNPDATDPEDDPWYRTIAIFWDGFEFNVGNNDFGANAEAHEGMFFYNYSLYSLGVHISGTVFNNTMYLVNTHLNAQSHPYNESDSGFELHVEGFNKVILSEAGAGFSENRWEYPILIWGKEISKSYWVYCFKFTLTAGIETWFTPGLDVNVNLDGSLQVDKTAQLRGAAYADASASIAGLASVGLYTYMDVITIDLIQSCYTDTVVDTENNKVRGSVNREVGVYLTGPKGYLDIYFEIDFVFFSKRWSKELFSYSSFRIPMLEMDFLTFTADDNYNLTHTNWIGMDDADISLDTSDSE
ncbi:MAG: hypothetical protein JW864_16490 [Spirochaetes bacterium]|nr:hypothetical protein [Spirochaetota bacterium]